MKWYYATFFSLHKHSWLQQWSHKINCWLSLCRILQLRIKKKTQCVVAGIYVAAGSILLCYTQWKISSLRHRAHSLVLFYWASILAWTSSAEQPYFGLVSTNVSWYIFNSVMINQDVFDVVDCQLRVGSVGPGLLVRWKVPTGHAEIIQILPFRVCVIGAPMSSALFRKVQSKYYISCFFSLYSHFPFIPLVLLCDLSHFPSLPHITS